MSKPNFGQKRSGRRSLPGENARTQTARSMETSGGFGKKFAFRLGIGVIQPMRQRLKVAGSTVAPHQMRRPGGASR